MVSFKDLFLFMIFWSVSAVTNAVLDLTDCPTQTISLHRAVLKDSMIEAFKNPEILRVNLAVTFISNSGKEEEGKGAGVFRDALSTFWNQFFNSLSVGAQEKVPAIRHDYQRGEWEAIARILVYGYREEKYFPSLYHEVLLHCACSVKRVWAVIFCCLLFASIFQKMREKLSRNVLQTHSCQMMMTF